MAINTTENPSEARTTPEQIAAQEKLLNDLRQQAAAELLAEKGEPKGVVRRFPTEAEKDELADAAEKAIGKSTLPLQEVHTEAGMPLEVEIPVKDRPKRITDLMNSGSSAYEKQKGLEAMLEDKVA